jgi:branched-chain amino acid transport system permease protein
MWSSLVMNGLVMGSILLLFSLGLTLIYGVGRVVNFAHGAFYSASAMTGVWLAQKGMPFWLVLIIAPIGIGILGVATDWLILSRIRDRPMVDSMLLTFGLALLITGILYELGGRNIQNLLIPDSLQGVTSFGDLKLPDYRIFLSVVAILLTAGLLAYLNKSTWGLRVRAANDEPEMAACLGINREVLMHSVVGVSSALAAVSGVIAAPIFGAFATVGDKILILGFMTVIMGGLGSLRGAIASAYLVGLVLVIGEGYFGGQLAIMVLFASVMVVLISFPRGIFGDGRTE